MKFFLILIFTSTIGFSQLRTQDLDDIIIVEPEQKEVVIERSIINNNINNRYISSSEMKDLISKNRISPLPYNSESTFGGLIFDSEGGISVCRDAPEPSTNSLFLLGAFILLYCKRKFKLNAYK